MEQVSKIYKLVFRKGKSFKMSRRSRAGTAEKPPSVEETVGRLEVKLKELELKYELREKEETNYRNSVGETLETLREMHKKVVIKKNFILLLILECKIFT